jgi:hypothetical protein
MDSVSGIKIGALNGVGSKAGSQGPSLARFLSQRANQVLGNRQQAAVVEKQVAPQAPQDFAPVNPLLARQMDQMQRLHSSISLPSNYQGISVLV